MDIHKITEQLLPIFDAHKNEENIEVEIRLGRHNGSLFDTNIGKDSWKKILRALEKYDGWEKKETKVVDVFYNDSQGVRITCDDDKQECIQKVNVCKQDFCDSGQPFDVRFCIAREIPTTGEYEMDRKRSKTRHSFIRKNLSIDMTISTGDNHDPDSEEESTYQVELEIIQPSKVDSDVRFHNILNKVNDIAKLL
jgi:hypothetical protein